MEQDWLEDGSVIHHELSPDFHDPQIRFFLHIIRASIKVLALLMVIVIVLDLDKTDPSEVWAIGVVALGITY